MTAYQLRLHLRDQHGLNLTGREYATLVYLHDVFHTDPTDPPDHAHDHAGEGDG